ncbi:PAS domain-containing protein [Phenylobacterium sp.]|jgi:PAS domain S-box-containing protein|uniref:hybrid sensor histidine kinase/response regulator n=1 Tax=Phenylobacterium sp. TaxID=1871053 RepID=UPI0037842D73
MSVNEGLNTVPGATLREAVGAWSWDMRGKRLFADARFAYLCGLDPDAAQSGLPIAAFVSGVVPDDRLRIKIALAGVVHGSDTFSKDYRVRGVDGIVRWVSARGRVERDAAGEPSRFTGVLADISDQKRVEEQLRIAQTAGGIGSFEHTDGFGTADVSAQFCHLLGLQPTDALPVRTINAVVHPGDPAIIRASTAADDGQSSYSELRIHRADTGELRWLARRGEHRSDGAGGGGRFIGVIYDITETKTAEDHLRELARTLEDKVAERTRERDRIWNRARDLFFVMSRDRAYQSINPAWTEVLGYEEADILTQKAGRLVHPDDAALTSSRLAQLERGEPLEDIDTRMRAKDGSWRWINWTVIPEGGFYYGMGRDVTERKQLEDQLRQSQKMEAVGQLTGGLAHDFNNMLTGVMGGLDLARRRIAQGRVEEAAEFLETATAAAERAAALTHRLLAFSRRQTLDPQAVDINLLVASIEDLLKRSLGEQVEIAFALAPGLWSARTDPNQLESAILNLAINARDAMPTGGQLTIETSNLTLDRVQTIGPDQAAAGDYVLLSVSDTGAGMPSEILTKVFDPFFTTKPIGQGTGLGLSMVYGFVRQSGGHVGIYSEPGIGTTVKLYLPRLQGELPLGETPVRAVVTPRGAGERVLLVEDDPQVRMLVHTVLEELGYQALEADHGAAALPILQSDTALNLLITDVGLPGINGRQLAEMARQHRPELPVLFITGYAANAAERASFLGPGMRMISKPFPLDSLARTLREMLEA